MNAMHFHEVIARRKLGQPAEWQACVLERVGPDALRLEGGVPRPLKTGNRKGRLTWRDCTITTCVVTDEEVLREQAAYEADTGNCAGCQGERQVPWSWHHIEGTKYRDCSKCNGTGKRAN